VSARRDAYIAANMYFDRPPGHAPAASFLGLVAEATRKRSPRATVAEATRGRTTFLQVSESLEGGVVEVRAVGAIDGPATRDALEEFLADVHKLYAEADRTTRSELVYKEPVAAVELVNVARGRGVRLRSWVDYQGLIDLGPLTGAQRERLAADSIYPEHHYVEQRFTLTRDASDPAAVIRDGLLDATISWLSTQEARLVVVLGDFGRGKTAFLRQLTRRLPDRLPDLVPVLVELRSLEKGPSLDDLLAQHLIRQDVDGVSRDKLRYMIDRGRVALLFDGFDELELRVGYDSAADYLKSLLNSLTGQAKVVLTSRTQHFLSTADVHKAVQTALGERVERWSGSQVAILQDFSDAQIVTYLTSLYGGDAIRARLRMELIRDIGGLLDLTRNPRMLAFVAQLTDERLRDVQRHAGTPTAGGLYQEIIDYWLATEEQRQSHSQGLAALTKDERFQVCTSLALRIWRTGQSSVSLDVLTAEVVATLTRLAERGFSDDQAAQSIGSGSLLVRDEDKSFHFIHLSVTEWLVAADAARQLQNSGTAAALQGRQMSRLMAAFFTDLAGIEAARAWASRTLVSADAPAPARQNALAVIDRLTLLESPRAAGARPARLDLSGLDLRTMDLNGRDLRDARMTYCNLSGMRLHEVNLEGADLTGADFTGAVLTGGSLLGARLTGSNWRYATILGTDTAFGGPWDPAQWPELEHAAIAWRDRTDLIVDAPNGKVECLAFSPDGALLAFGSDAAVKVADVATGRVLRVMTEVGGRHTVTALAFSPDGTLIAAGSSDGLIRLWAIATVALRAACQESRWWGGGPRAHGGRVTSLAFSPDGVLIASASSSISDPAVRVWRADSGALRLALPSIGTVRRVRFLDEGRLVLLPEDAPGRPAQGVIAWDLVSRAWRDLPEEAGNGIEATMRADDFTEVSGDVGRTVTATARSPAGSVAASAYNDRAVELWDLTAGTRHATLRGPAAQQDVALAPGLSHVATATRSRPEGSVRGFAVRVWNAANGTRLTTIDDAYQVLGFSPNGSLIAVRPLAKDIVRVHDVTGALRATLTKPTSRRNAWGMREVALSPDGALAAVLAFGYRRDPGPRVLEVATGKLRARLSGHRGRVTSIAFSPDGTLIATAARDGTARLWDAATGAHRATLTKRADPRFDPYGPYSVTAVAFSPDGGHVAGILDGVAHVWDITASKDTRLPRLSRRRPVLDQPITLTEPRGGISRLAYSPDGTLLAAACGDGSAWVWRLADRAGYPVGTPQGQAAMSVGFSADGTVLATTTADNVVRFLDLATGTVRSRLIALPDGGFLAHYPDGSYQLHGDPGDRVWWAMKLCRFGPGKLDPYVPEIRRLPDDAPILPQPLRPTTAR
jgi:WD40 repeat protein